MINQHDIRRRLIELLDDETDLESFEDWLVSNSWDMHKESSADACQLVSDIELVLFEYSNAHLTEADALRKLQNLQGAVSVHIDLDNRPVRPVIWTAAAHAPVMVRTAILQS